MLVPEFVKDKLRGSNLYLYLKLFPKWFAPDNPKIMKIQLIRKIALFSKIKRLVETGTNEGETIFQLYHDFDRIISIELSEKLFRYAKKRFLKYPKIKLIKGDSAVVLMDIVKDLSDRAIFWLDAHYDGPVSGKLEAKSVYDPPLLYELEAILNSDLDHFILIDDARNFGKLPNYPGVSKLAKKIRLHKNNYDISVQEDIIFCVPKSFSIAKILNTWKNKEEKWQES